MRLDKPPYARTRWETPDGDFIDIDRIEGKKGQPLLVLFHGLEGHSSSHYARSLMNRVQREGWHGAAVHFRGCSGEPNLLARAYHSGDSAEIGWVLQKMRHDFPHSPIFAAGVSLGGNALLKWLGEEKEIVDAAAAVSAPVDLRAAGDALGSGFNLIYTQHFLKTLKTKVLRKLDSYPHLLDGKALLKARTLREFDDIYTAPIHGFRDAEDYWEKSASRRVLRKISVPTLVLNARNDPFLPASFLPGKEDASEKVTLEYPEEGGHAGFVCGPFPGNIDWLPDRLLHFFGESLRMERQEGRPWKTSR